MVRQKGFTLIELTLAMTIFSFMLLIVSSGFLHIVRIQESGVVSRNTQQNARLALEQVVREARTASDSAVLASGTLCLVAPSGLVLYRIKPDNRLWRATMGYNPALGTVANACNSGTIAGDSAVTATNVAVTVFAATEVQTPSAAFANPNPKSLQLRLTVTSTDFSQLNAAHTSCLAQSGSQFCSVTSLNSTASLRGTP